MVGNKNSARVSILGHELRVKTETDSAYVEEIARFVEDRVRTATAEGAPLSTGAALLAAMNIADDLYAQRRVAEAEETERTRRIEGLLKRLEDALIV